jgi:hypothetical protein
VNFKDYFNLESEKKNSKMGINTGNEHHKRVGRLMGSGLNRKSLNFVARTHTEKKHEHPKITLCLTNKKNVGLTHPEALDIIDKYGVCPTPEENSKAIKQTGVHIILVSPKVYILAFKGDKNGNTALFK